MICFAQWKVPRSDTLLQPSVLFRQKPFAVHLFTLDWPPSVGCSAVSLRNCFPTFLTSFFQL